MLVEVEKLALQFNKKVVIYDNKTGEIQKVQRDDLEVVI